MYFSAFWYKESAARSIPLGCADRSCQYWYGSGALYTWRESRLRYPGPGYSDRPAAYRYPVIDLQDRPEVHLFGTDVGIRIDILVLFRRGRHSQVDRARKVV